jgi:hypothetical protein
LFFLGTGAEGQPLFFLCGFLFDGKTGPKAAGQLAVECIYIRWQATYMNKYAGNVLNYL